MRQRKYLDLTVKGEAIERVYSNFRSERYVVNRRYQRKLVWSIEEKQSFIDSIASNYPVPIILLADPNTNGQGQVEIIDGMQRLNAVISFIENEFPVDGAYFDLNSLATTKSLLDNNDIMQRTPILDRRICVQIASYQLPLSIFESPERGDIEEVFRRINSGGRKLSRQELRIAGATGDFPTAVRRISAIIRGDSSASDLVLLNNMKQISITSKNLDYGIDIESVFWVRNGILTKDQVRESRDEEIVADMMSFMVAQSPPPSRSEYLDTIFGFRLSGGSPSAFDENELHVRKYSLAALTAHFQKVMDELRVTLEGADTNLGQLLFKTKPARAPRYFQVIFLALFDQLIKKRKKVDDRTLLLKSLRGSGDKINITEGGSWGAQNRADEVTKLSALISKAFVQTDEPDPAVANWINQFETILTQSLTEQAAYDFKQGFLRLDESGKFDEDNFEKIVQTIVAISNIGEGRKGYLIIGVADKRSDAERIKKLYNIEASPHRGFFVTGIEHEAKALKQNIDTYFRSIVSKLKSRLENPLRNFVLSNIKLVNYYNKSVLVIEIEGQAEPSNVDGDYYVRHGNMLEKIDRKGLISFIKNYPTKRGD